MSSSVVSDHDFGLRPDITMQSYRFIQFSDTHLSGDASARLRGVACLPALQSAMSDASRRCHDPDGILLTGDLVQDDPDGYRWIRHMFGASKVPVMCLSGNHDLPNHMKVELAREPFQVGGEREFGRSGAGSTGHARSLPCRSGRFQRRLPPRPGREVAA